MRLKRHHQRGLDFSSSHLTITNEYYAKYEAISNTLDEVPDLVDLVHRDLERSLKRVNGNRRLGRKHFYTSEHVLRILLCQSIEGESLRGIVVRIDDSHFLRRFVRVDNGRMMDYTTLCKLKNSIREETWREVNRRLVGYCVERKKFEGHELRLDTTAVETNIHYPTDSSLLWDVYRVLARLIERARKIDPDAVGSRRLQSRRAKRLQQKINRGAASRRGSAKRLKPLYRRLIEQVECVSDWAHSVRKELAASRRMRDVTEQAAAEGIVKQLDHYLPLGARVLDQARRRVLEGESVPNDEKLFSIFEPDTELLKRGKAGKEIEFGHMIQIQQVAGKLITDYSIFERRPEEPPLLQAAIDSHRKLFGSYPNTLAADKGYYDGLEALEQLSKKIPVVSIAKKGRRTVDETEREHDPIFRLGQRFRAGIEGTISFLKRVLRLTRCFNKGWQHFVTTVAQTIFAHNLLILARC